MGGEGKGKNGFRGRELRSSRKETERERERNGEFRRGYDGVERVMR